jgi:DNA repair ATPase RecN
MIRHGRDTNSSNFIPLLQQYPTFSKSPPGLVIMAALTAPAGSLHLGTVLKDLSNFVSSDCFKQAGDFLAEHNDLLERYDNLNTTLKTTVLSFAEQERLLVNEKARSAEKDAKLEACTNNLKNSQNQLMLEKQALGETTQKITDQQNLIKKLDQEKDDLKEQLKKSQKECASANSAKQFTERKLQDINKQLTSTKEELKSKCLELDDLEKRAFKLNPLSNDEM